MTTEAKPVDDFDKAFADAISTIDANEVTTTAKPGAAPAAAAPLVDEAALAAEAAKKTADDAAAKKVADDAAAATAAAETAKKTADDAAAKKVADDAAAATAAAAALAADPAAAAAKKTADEAAAKKAADDAAAKRAEEIALAAAKKVADDAAAKKVADDAAAKAAAAAEIKDPVLSDESKKKLTKLGEEWPDIASAVSAQVEHAMAQMEAKFARALATVVGQVYDHMQPMAQSFVNVETNEFRKAVVGKHDDYDAILPKLESWIATQPSYLADAYKRVYTSGNAQEVIDLVSRYKEANGVKSQAPAATIVTPNPAATSATSSATAASAAALAPVTGKRTTPTPKGEDPNDFDGAFAEAAALLDPSKK